MVHGHPVVDTDHHFIIDPTTRAVTNAEMKKTMLIQGDHNSERFSFELDRYVEGHDMSLCNRIEVHYTNTQASNRATNAGVYDVEDFGIAESDDSKVVFTWLISDEATLYSGNLSFLIMFSCIEDGTTTYRWHTAINTSMNIGPGMNNGEAIAEAFPDILAQWKADLFSRNYSYEGAVQNGFEGTEEEWYEYLIEWAKTTTIWDAKQNNVAWVTEGDIDAMFNGTYSGVEDESSEGTYNIPDYDQNDENGAGYIKNRPFYEATELVGESKIWAYEMGCSFGLGVGKVTIGKTLFYEVDEPDGMKTGSFVVEVVNERRNINDDYSYQFNSYVNEFDGLTYEGLNFIRIAEPTVDIPVRIYHNNIAQIDEKFIPDAIARVEDLNEFVAYDGYVEEAITLCERTSEATIEYDARLNGATVDIRHVTLLGTTTTDSIVLDLNTAGIYRLCDENVMITITGNKEPFEIRNCASSGSIQAIAQIKNPLISEDVIPDTIARTADMDSKIGEIETVLDEIIGIQNSLIGGESYETLSATCDEIIETQNTLTGGTE